MHFALQKGEVKRGRTNPGARSPQKHLSVMYLGLSVRLDRSMDLPGAMERVAKEGGVLVVLGREESNEELINIVKQFEAEDQGEKPVTNLWKGTSRTVGVGCQILKTLGVQKMRLTEQAR